MDVAFSGLAKPMIGTFDEADAFHQDASELLRSVADEPLGEPSHGGRGPGRFGPRRSA